MPNNEFQVLIQAIIDAKDVQTRLNAIKDLSVKIEKVHLDQSAIDLLRNQLSKNGIDVNLVLGNVNQVQTEATKAGQQIGKQIQTGIDNAIQKGNFDKIFKGVTNGLNSAGKEAEEYFKQLSNVVSVQERLGDKNNLESFIVSLKHANGIVEQLRYKLKENEEDKFFEYTGGSINDNGVIKQFNAISSAADSLQIKVEKLRANYSDLNAPKAIKDSDHLSALDQQYDKILQSVSELRTADNSTFTSMQTNVKSGISALESMIQQYKNAEYAATSLRSKDIATIKLDEGNNLDTFVQKMEQSGHYTEDLKAKVSTLKTDLSNVFDSNSLTSYLNKLSNLQSEFKSVDATAKTLEKSTKLQVNIDAEHSVLKNYENTLKESGVYTDDLKQKIKALSDSLGAVTTPAGLSTWRAELKGAKSEIDDVIRTASKSKEIQFSLDNGAYSTQINKIKSQFQAYGLSVDEAENKVKELRTTLATLEISSGNERMSTFDTWERQIKGVKVQLDQAKLSYNKFAQPVSDEKVSSLILKIQNFLSKNTAITKEARIQLERYAAELNGKNISLKRWNDINNELARTDSQMRELGRLGKSLKDQFAQAAGSFTQWISVSSLIMTGVYNTKAAISDLKDLDDTLTEISKTSDLTKTQLQEIGSTSFSKASDFGKDANDYLTGVMEMSRSGYYGEKGEEMARTSLMAQAAGDMTAELANKYVLATNAAYKYNGEAERLNTVLDGQNMISNRNSVAMSDMAAAMSEAGTVAASYRVSIEDLSAMIGTIESVTKLGGNEVGTGIKSLLINLQNISSSKIVGTLDDANASMTEMVNGVEQLRDPISILRDLAKTFNELDEADPMRAKILTNIGGKYQATKLAALLSNMSMFDKMLVDYSEGAGSALTEAEKSATNLSGSLNRLENTWDSIVNNIIDANELTGIVKVFTEILSVVNKITGALGSLGTTGATLGAILGAKNVGGSKMSDPTIVKCGICRQMYVFYWIQ